MNFADRLLEATEKKGNPSVIGLDSDFRKIPDPLKESFLKKYGNNMRGVSECMLEFNRRVINSIRDLVPAVKIQAAFYEMYGPDGMRTFRDTADYAREKGLIVIGDVKRNDIGNTAGAYSSAYLGKVDVFGRDEDGMDLDAITVNPYLGSDGIKPFLSDCRSHDKGLFVLVRTSNPSSLEIQDLETKHGRFYEIVCRLVNSWGDELTGERGYSSVGAVVGATFPEELGRMRKIMGKSIFLVPGFGAQGGGAKDIVNAFRDDGTGALIHSARGVIFSFTEEREEEFDICARESCIRMRDEIKRVLGEER